MIISSLNVLIEALRSGETISKVYISDSRQDKKIGVVLDLCKKKGVPFQRVPQQTVTRKAGPDNQGVFAEGAAVDFVTLEEIMGAASSGLLLILDGVTDTGNMGAIIRSAAAAGVDGVIVTERNCAPINETVLKTSAGTLLKVKLHRAKNLNDTIKRLKKENYWIAVTDMDGTTPYYDYDFSYPTAVIMGSEDKGVASLLKKNADHLLSIPISPSVESLNVSAATAVILFEARKQKRNSEL